MSAGKQGDIGSDLMQTDSTLIFLDEGALQPSWDLFNPQFQPIL
jgi:hypothetical protein